MHKDGLIAGFLRAPGPESAARTLGWPQGLPVASLKQVHGARCVTLQREAAVGDRPEADAAVFRGRGLALSVRTADCVPLLLWGGELTAVAHAGWRGCAAGVVDVGCPDAIAQSNGRLVCSSQSSTRAAPQMTPSKIAAVVRPAPLPARPRENQDKPTGSY